MRTAIVSCGAIRASARSDRPDYFAPRDPVGASCAKDLRGKIMRCILRKIAANETDSLGGTSTLADPAVVTELVENRVQ